MKKIIPIIILVIILIIVEIKITNKNLKAEININMEELATELIDAQIFEDSLDKIDKDTILKKWSFSTENIKDIVSYVGTGATAEEILIIELNDKKDADQIEKIIKDEIEERKEDFQNYLPKEVYKLENYNLKIKNNYIILCISNNYDKADEIINKYIKS